MVGSRSTDFNCYTGWILYEKKFSNKAFFVHLIGNCKLDKYLTTHASYGGIMTYLDLLNSMSTGRNELFGFLISDKRIVFIKSNYNKGVLSQVTIRKPIHLSKGFIYLKSLVNYLKPRDFPNDIGDFINYQFQEVECVGSGVSS